MTKIIIKIIKKLNRGIWKLTEWYCRFDNIIMLILFIIPIVLVQWMLLALVLVLAKLGGATFKELWYSIKHGVQNIMG